MKLIPNDLMYDTLIDLTFDLVMATLLAPGIHAHLFPFIKSPNRDSNENIKKTESNVNQINSECDKKSIEVSECSKMDKKSEDNNSGDNLERATKLFGQLLDNTRSYFMFDDKASGSAEPTEEFIKQKEVQLNRAHEFLTDVVLNQDPSFPVDNKELNQSFKFIKEEFTKLDKLKESVKLTQKTTNSIESNLDPSYFAGDSSPNLSSEGEEDFEIIN